MGRTPDQLRHRRRNLYPHGLRTGCAAPIAWSRTYRSQLSAYDRKRSYEYGEKAQLWDDKPMINFIEGRLNIVEKNILAACDDDLKTLAE